MVPEVEGRGRGSGRSPPGSPPPCSRSQRTRSKFPKFHQNISFINPSPQLMVQISLLDTYTHFLFVYYNCCSQRTRSIKQGRKYGQPH